MASSRSNTPEDLLRAAEELFSERGFAGVGNREITARAGANIAAIKYHFGSKQGLYEATVQRALANPEILEVWESLRDTPTDGDEAIRLLVRFIRRLLAKLLSKREFDAFAKLMVREALRPSEPLTRFVIEQLLPFDEMLMRVLQVIDPGMSRSDSLNAVWCILGQVYHLYLFRTFHELQERTIAPGAGDSDHLATFMIHFSLRGLGCSEERIEGALRGEDENEPDHDQ
jgi:TetR/AcrR family transcriptional regulator, regulator of cefoperazone and chloramphenicol sensitivity